MGSLSGFLQAHVEATDDNHRVTTIELLFDLVFVYAITNVTGLMEHDIGGDAVLEGLITLAVVWFGWCSYAWLGNQARADRGVLRLAMVVAMGAMFFVAISIPHAFDDGGNAAAVLVIAYAVVRLTHLAVYLIAAGDDAQLRSVIYGMLGVSTVMLVLLSIGAVVGGESQRFWWLAAVVSDQIGVYVVRSTRWRMPSAPHFAERFGLVVIIAIGESVVAVGASTSSADLSGRDAVALVCGLAIAVCVWWLYFDEGAAKGEAVLLESSQLERVRLGRDSYTYVHFVLVAGIVFVALGLMLLIGDHDHIDAGRNALYGGVACYLVGDCLFCWRHLRDVKRARLAVAALIVAGIPTLGGLTTLGQVAVPAIVLIGLVVLEASSRASVTPILDR
jgi:low temperature requirement protein LtrA